MSALGVSPGSARGPRPSFWPSRGKMRKLEPAGLGQAREHGNVAATVGRPLFRDHEQLRRTAGLRHEPSDGGDLSVADPGAPVPLAQEPAEVVPLQSQPPAGLTREILRGADVGDVLVEGVIPGRIDLASPRVARDSRG